MQTFLPSEYFDASAAALDRSRLGKQRVEALQLLNALAGRSKGWTTHPAARMWRGYEAALCVYGIVVCCEWRNRGYKDSVLPKLLAMLPELTKATQGLVRRPPWLGDAALHASHRSNLLRKLPAHYAALGWRDPDCLPYVWPHASLG